MSVRSAAAFAAIFAFAAMPASSQGQTSKDDGARLGSRDVFELEYADDPRISPDGEQVVYLRAINDIMADRTRRNLWIVETDGSGHRPLISGKASISSPRFSPDGARLAYFAAAEGKRQIFLRWMDTGQTALVTNLTERPGDLAFSPDGEWIAFTMKVPAEKPSLAKPPKQPDGADWAPPVKVIDQVVYRFNGRGYLEPGFTHVFVVPAEGGSPRQLTSGDYDHGGALSWSPDGERIYFSANRTEDWQYERTESDIWSVEVASGEMTQLTDLPGVESSPVVSPDGERIAFARGDHQERQFWITTLAVMNVDGSQRRILTAELDRSIEDPVWAADGSGLYYAFDDRGVRKVGFSALDGTFRIAAEGLGGTSLGRPYTSGGFTVADTGAIAYNAGTPQRPADLHLRHGDDVRRLTSLNEDLLAHRALGELHEITYASSVDGTQIQGWYLTPPDFDPEKRYPLILEIHGGPHAAYGPHFSTEMQRYAAEGYVVFYDNHRGSASYGEDFGLKLEYKYASKEDFGDHMSGVDAMIDLGFVDPDALFVTGGSAGGIAAAYAIGLTDRFKAAAVAKPVINWVSKILTGDIYTYQAKHQFPAMPWEAVEHYWQRSPLSLVGNVTTPTLLITGEEDFRTPISETEQFYQALKLRRVDTVMVRVPGASHGIAARPSHLVAKVDNILAWFAKYGGPEMSAADGQ